MAAGDLFKKIWGTTRSLWGVGGPKGINVKANSGGELRNAGDSDFVVGRASHIAAAGSANDLATLLNIQSSGPNITWDFDGSSPPTPNDNPNEWGICHTTGGAYTAGRIYYDDAASLVLMPTEICRKITSSTAVTGTVSLISNGVYALEGGNWVLKGDVVQSFTSLPQVVEIAVGTAASTNSTTSIPDGSRVVNTYLKIETAYDSSATIIIKVDGAADEILIAAADVELDTIYEVESDNVHIITSSNEGVVNVALTGSPTVGAAKVLVTYVTPKA
jgi:hypothetical protein